MLHYRPLPACYPHAAGPHRRGRTRSNLSPSTPRTRCLARSGRPEGTYIIATGPPIGLDPDRPRDAARTGGWGASRSSPRISGPKQSSAGIVARRCVRSRASRNGSFLIHFVLAQAGQSTQPCAARTVALCSRPDTSSFALEFARICASCTPREAVAMGAVTAPIQPQPR